MPSSRPASAPTARPARRPGRRRSARGFTLIELMVVIVILGLLIGLVGTNVWNMLFSSTRDTAKMQMRNIGQSIDMYKARNRTLPKSLEELTQPDPSTGEPFMETIPLDPWGQAYDFRVVDARRNRFEIRSGGEDKVLDTEDDLVFPERDGEK